jgi:hypothetical protein
MKNELQNFLNLAPARVNALVAYENLVFAIEALDLCDRLSKSLARDVNCNLAFGASPRCKPRFYHT